MIRYKTPDTAIGGIIDLREAGNFLGGRQGTGTVHHIAFRAASDALQAEMVEKLAGNHGIRATDLKDRNYFRSVYFREPNGICSKSPPMIRALPSTSRPSRSGRD